MKQSNKQNIIVILCITLAIGLMVLLTLNGWKDRKQANQLESVAEKALPLEQELRQLENELDELLNASNVCNPIAQVIIAYQIETEDDFQLIEEQEKIYNIFPAIVIDVASEKAEELILQAQEKDYSIILTATPLNEGVLQSAVDYKNKYDLNYFLLRNVDDNEEVLDFLAASGFEACIRYLKLTENVVLDNGLVCTNYSLIKSGNFSVGSRLNQLVTSKQSLVFVFDLAGKQLTDDTIVYDLNCIADWVKQGELAYVSLQEALTSIQENHMASVKLQGDSTDAIAQLQRRIGELEDSIDEIYSHWNGD